MSQPAAESWSTREVAQYLRLFVRNPRTGEPDPTQPDLNKVHGFAHRNADFPRPRKLGRVNLYDVAEIKAWLMAQRRGGPSAPPAETTNPAQKRRGPKPKAGAR